MKPFMDEDFLLTTDAARQLYHGYAKGMPIFDYHCHVSPQEIYENKRFANIYEAWLSGDHYKWRLMRWAGVEERYITGDAPQREKFRQFARVLPRAIGNPLYHWCHLELKTYFGYEGVLNEDTAAQVWDLCEEKFRQPGMDVRGLIAQSNVAFIGTTDDPVDTLEWHEKLRGDTTFSTRVAPSFRPDRAVNIDKPGWKDYIGQLSAAAGTTIDSLAALEAALATRMEAFARLGCRASDHGLDHVPFSPATAEQTETIFQKAMAGQPLATGEADAFKTHMLLFLGRSYHKLDWVMQIHYNCLRNPNSAMFAALGPDSGFDSMNALNCAGETAGLLNRLYGEGTLPRTVLYSLNPADNEVLQSIAGAFQGGGIPGRVQHGSGWWFNDTKSGMLAQITSLANLGILGDFIGMLTDSRSFLSYTRHDYFRRILCEFVGGLVAGGEYPGDIPAVGALVQDICYNNAARYFSFEVKKNG